jgi:hypothetical protein
MRRARVLFNRVISYQHSRIEPETGRMDGLVDCDLIVVDAPTSLQLASPRPQHRRKLT